MVSCELSYISLKLHYVPRLRGNDIQEQLSTFYDSINFGLSMKNRIFLSPPHMGGSELDYVKAAFDSNYIAPLGPMVDAFENAFAEKVGIAHAVALVSGTAAMHLAMRILDIGPGDEVFASTLTFMGSVSPVVFQGARPVFIDADLQTWNMDPDLLAEELLRCSHNGQLPKAVVPTDLYGQSADLDRIMEICEPYGVPVVADSAEALGATYHGRHAGAGAHATVFFVQRQQDHHHVGGRPAGQR